MPKNILLVEDDKDIRKNLARLLLSEGYSVDLASNGIEALQFLQSTPLLPNLIVLDLMMPQMDGFQFRIEQQKDAKIANIPVIIMTADGNISEKRVRVGAAAAIKKPADIELILSTVKQFCP